MRRCAAAFAAQRPIPGRMEPVDRGQPFPVFVDYAHTDAALDAALRSAREVVGGGKVAVVFGCGGDRDRGKRPLMGRVAGELADLPIATSDNPRSEDPLAILARSRRGSRRAATRNTGWSPTAARRSARPSRRPAPAGPCWWRARGTSASRSSATQKLPFSDFEEIGKALEERFGPAVSSLTSPAR